MLQTCDLFEVGIEVIFEWIVKKYPTGIENLPGRY